MHNIEGLDKINKSILTCKNLKIKDYLCKRDVSAKPLVMKPLLTQKVMLITRDPSNIANLNQTLTGYDNTFFREHILAVFFKDYSMERFKHFAEIFEIIVFWTHFAKC